MIDKPSYWAMKRDALYGVRQALGTARVVAFAGDSRAAAMPWMTLCELPAIEVGMPGASVRQASPYIAKAIEDLRPAATVLQIGVNNCWVDLASDEWNTVPLDMAVLIAHLKEVAPVVVTTPVPPEIGAWAPASDTRQRAAWLQNFAINIQNAAREAQVPVVDLCPHFSLADGTAWPGTTWDGIHFTAATYAKIKALVEPALAKVLAR